MVLWTSGWLIQFRFSLSIKNTIEKKDILIGTVCAGPRSRLSLQLDALVTPTKVRYFSYAVQGGK